MERKRRAEGGLWLTAVGVAVLSLLWIPQLALYIVYPLIIRAVLTGMLLLVVLHYRSTRNAMAMVIVLAGWAWLMDIGEVENLVSYVIAGLALVLITKNGEENVWIRVAFGCLIGALVLVAGTAVLRVWHKESEVGKAIEYGLLREWPTLVAGLIGAYGGIYLANRWNRAQNRTP